MFFMNHLFLRLILILRDMSGRNVYELFVPWDYFIVNRSILGLFGSI